jgi:hypothetical protein
MARDNLQHNSSKSEAVEAMKFSYSKLESKYDNMRREVDRALRLEDGFKRIREDHAVD